MEAQIQKLKKSLDKTIDQKDLCEIIQLLQKKFEDLTSSEK